MQWTVAYLAIAWVVLQLMDILAEIWSWSVFFQQVVSLVLAFGTLPVLVVAWFHGEKGRQEICPWRPRSWPRPSWARRSPSGRSRWG